MNKQRDELSARVVIGMQTADHEFAEMLATMAIKELKAIIAKENQGSLNYSAAEAHPAADNVLCNLLKVLGFADVVKVYEDVPKWFE